MQPFTISLSLIPQQLRPTNLRPSYLPKRPIHAIINLMLATIGLLIIVVAWVIQLAATTPDHNQILLLFVAFYMIGVFLVVVDSFQSGLTINTGLNFVAFLTSALTLYKLKK